MTKIMLVEDDKSLREIYGVRLLAEGYDIVSAGDGEEALAMAIKERPQLIVSDVMMPKISGFDMLDILRSTTETKNIKVIMMTALSSEEQRNRGESLGADRYLVKSQVGIEDVVRVVHEVLADGAAPAQPAAANAPAPASRPAAPAVPARPPTTPAVPTTPTPPSPTPVPPTPPATGPTSSGLPQPTNLSSPVTPPTMPTPVPVAPAVPTPSTPPSPLPANDTTPTPEQPPATPKPASIKTRVIQPLDEPSVTPVNMGELLDKEIAQEAGITDDARPTVNTADEERQLLNDQLEEFTRDDDGSEQTGATPPPPPPPPAAPTA